MVSVASTRVRQVSQKGKRAAAEFGKKDIALRRKNR